MMKKGIIYVFTNKENGLQYVGQTTKELKQRTYQHVYDATKRKVGGKFYNALRKYSINNFEVEVVYEIYDETLESLVKKLNEVEHTEIEKRNSINNGYNTERGGRNHTNKNPLKISKSKMNTVYKNSNIIEQYDLNGEFIERYDTAIQAQRATGAHNSHILRVCRGERKTHKGFIWKFGHIKSDELREHPVKS